MSVPWYVSGAPRPEYTKYEGYEKDVEKTRQLVAAVRRAQQPQAVSAHTTAPSSTPASSWGTYDTRVAWPTQEEVVAQAPSPVSTKPGVGDWFLDKLRRAGDVYANSMSQEKADEAATRRKVAIENYEQARSERDEVLGPFGLSFDPTSTNPITREPGINFAGGKTKKRQAQEEAAEASRSQQVQNVADYYNAMARRAKIETERAEREKNNREEISEEMTWDDWLALSPLQQAGVAFNADLDAAVRRDRRLARNGGHSASMDDLEAYQAGMEEIFGENDQLGVGGLQYAPETLALLQSRGITQEDVGDRTIDDFLLMDTALSMKQVNRLEEGGTPRNERLALAQALAEGQLAFQEEQQALLAKGDQLLVSMTTPANAEAVAALGGTPRPGVPKKLEFENPEQEELVTTYLWGLANPEWNPEEVVSDIQYNMAEKQMTPEQQRTVYDMMLNRAMNAATSQEWFPTSEADSGIKPEDLRPPTDVAVLLGAVPFGGG